MYSASPPCEDNAVAPSVANTAENHNVRALVEDLERNTVGRDAAETPIPEDEEKPAGGPKTSASVAHREAEGEEDDEWC